MATNGGVSAHAPPAIYINALQSPMLVGMDVWNTSARSPLRITYSFATAQPFDAPNYLGWTAFSDSQKATVRSVLAEYASFINVTFAETTGLDPDITFGRVQLGTSESGEGGFRYTYQTNSLGQIVSRTLDGFAVFDRADSVIARYTILHEIGHALTLKHPGSYDSAGALAVGPYLPTALDNNKYTVMSYRADPDNGLRSGHLMLLDIAALQARFGANVHYHLGNNIYTSPAGHIQVVWDAGGYDTISGGGYHVRLTIDLREGFFSSLGASNNLAIAYGTVIENADGGGAADTLIGNQWNNLLRSHGGNDVLCGRGGNDRLVGGPGGDQFLFNTALSTANVDVIADFTHSDLIVLDRLVFKAFPNAGVLQSAWFFAGSAAHDRNDHIMYNANTGAIIYDANGSDPGAAVVFARIHSALSITAADFYVI